jgi:4-hydroxyphenylpyruvate dioxygenase
VFVFKSALNPNNKVIGSLLETHGDHVKDIAFSVNDLDYIVKRAVDNGAKLVQDIHELRDENGYVRLARIQTYGDVTHTLIERSNYKGEFMPGYKPHYFSDPLESTL